MIRYQLTYLLQRRDFRVSFLLMLFIAGGYPVFLVYTKLMQGADLGTVCDPRYAYMFFSHSDLMDYFPFIFPIISLFPAAISFNIDRNTNYYNIIVSKCGIRKYLYSYALIAILGGLFMMIFPLLINILFSYAMFPHTNYGLLYSNFYEDTYDLANNYSSYPFLQLLWHRYPIISDLYSALRASVCMSVFSLITYVTSVFIQPKYTFMSIIPVSLLVFSGRYLTEMLDSEVISLDFMQCIGSLETSECSIILFWSILAILTVISFAILHLKTKKDMI